VKTTILMLSVDEAPLLEHSLPAAVAQRGAQVMVVDNASSDPTPDLCESHGARYMRLRERVSYCAAINAGLAATDGDAVLLLNADCVVGPGFVEALVAHLEAPDVGSVAPRLVRSQGMTEAERLDVLDAAGMTIDRRRKNGLVGHGAPESAYAAAGECFGADGAAALYRRETLDACAIDGEVLDEDMALWASDADLAWRARLLGWRCAYEPGAIATHVRAYSPSTRAEASAAHRRLQFRNRLLMIAKNETGAAFARDAPRILAYEVAALGYALLREHELLGGYRDAWRLRAGARRRRRAVQARVRDPRPPFGLEPRPE
jgi:GT2 family glycosyltransferase